MITGKGTYEDKPMLLMGLSGENVTRLMAGEPIVLDGAKVGFDNLMVVLIGGETEGAMAAALTVHGFISATTTIHDHRPPRTT